MLKWIFVLAVTLSMVGFFGPLGGQMVQAARPPWAGGEGGTATATIELIQCNGAAAKWGSSTVKVKIVDASGTGATADVQSAIGLWNASQNNYDLEVVEDGEDVLIELYGKIVPGYILGYTDPVCEESGQNLASAYIALGVNGLTSIGRQNLAAHEIGHALGLGHGDKKGDLMYPSFDSKEERKQIVCVSNLDANALAATGSTYSLPENITWGCAP